MKSLSEFAEMVPWTWGRYSGPLRCEFLDDGRQMRVLEKFSFYCKEREHWLVPAGAQTDGASIPQALWSILGGPFEGKYRNAAVVHDYYCDVRVRRWQDVHRMFYHAMRASRVSAKRAKLMYFGVRLGGPRWSDQAIANSRLPKPPLSDETQLKYLRENRQMLEFNLSQGAHNNTNEAANIVFEIFTSPNPPMDVPSLVDNFALASSYYDLPLSDVDVLADLGNAILAETRFAQTMSRSPD